MGRVLGVLVLIFAVLGNARAGQVEIRHARLERQADGTWEVQVTLRHADTGWEHYADAWRVVTAAAKVLGTRTLLHPHVDEQPFTRGLGGLRIPDGIRQLWIEAHDKVHGWSPRRLDVDLDTPSGPGFEVFGAR